VSPLWCVPTGLAQARNRLSLLEKTKGSKVGVQKTLFANALSVEVRRMR
jgi:hypothetical protein